MSETKTIKVIHLCSGVSYCTAAYRISQALQVAGVESKIICNTSDVTDAKVMVTEKTKGWKLKKIIDKYGTLVLTKKIYNMGKNGPFSLGILGNSKIFHCKDLREADIIHLHWINEGMLSISDVKKLGKYGKPIVITTHDMWFMTGGCHVSGGCEKFESGCGKCKALQSNRERDISHYIITRKKKDWLKLKLYITSPSKHTNERVKKSYLFKDTPNIIIPNTLDIKKFHYYDNEKNKGEISILFGATHILLPHKGFQYLVDALKIYKKKYSHETVIRLLVLGKGVSNLKIDGYKIEYLGFLDDEEKISKAYSRASVFVVPSLEDTFNQSVAEAMACETPVVAFDGIGITDIVDHKVNGYLAKYKDVEDLADGIEWVLNQDKKVLGVLAREKVVTNFNYEKVGNQFKNLYERILNE